MRGGEVEVDRRPPLLLRGGEVEVDRRRGGRVRGGRSRGRQEKRW